MSANIGFIQEYVTVNEMLDEVWEMYLAYGHPEIDPAPPYTVDEYNAQVGAMQRVWWVIYYSFMNGYNA